MKTVAIVGVGALGSHVAMLLRNEAELRLIDFDRVEAKNTASAFHSKPNVSKLKVESLRSTLQFLWGTKVNTLSAKVDHTNVDVVLHKADLVIDCLDNGAGRRHIQTWVRKTLTPCLHGALAADGAFGRAIWDENFVIDDGAAGAPTCEGHEHLPYVSIVSSYIARAAQLFLRENRKVGFSISPFAVTAV